MGCLGVHFALTSAQADAVWEAYEGEGDEGVLAEVEKIEALWDKAHLQETDKAWDAIHRCLSDGSLWPGVGEWPLVGAVLGGECLYYQTDYIVSFLDADDVKEVSAALKKHHPPVVRYSFRNVAADRLRRDSRSERPRIHSPRTLPS